MDEAYTRQLLGQIDKSRSDAAMVLWCCYFVLTDEYDFIAPPHSPERNATLKLIHQLGEEVRTIAQSMFIKRDSQAGKAAALQLPSSEQRRLAYNSHLMNQFSAITPIRETLWGPVDAAGRRAWKGKDADANASGVSWRARAWSRT